jgi:hypothetical protein
VTDARLHDRRTRMVHASLVPGSRPCRLCLRVVVLKPEYVEMTEQHVYVRCPHCRGSFPIRHSDIDMFLGTEEPTT